jgi:hypothetical protein
MFCPHAHSNQIEPCEQVGVGTNGSVSDPCFNSTVPPILPLQGNVPHRPSRAPYPRGYDSSLRLMYTRRTQLGHYARAHTFTGTRMVRDPLEAESIQQRSDPDPICNGLGLCKTPLILTHSWAEDR